MPFVIPDALQSKLTKTATPFSKELIVGCVPAYATRIEIITHIQRQINTHRNEAINNCNLVELCSGFPADKYGCKNLGMFIIVYSFSFFCL
jgi:hypothetical protein